MPRQNVYVDVGARGFTAPDADLFLRNLFDLDWGLFTFGPLLVLAVVPTFFFRDRPRVMPGRERWFALAFAFNLINAG